MAFDVQRILANLTSGREFLKTVSGGRIDTSSMPAPVGFLLDTVANPATLASAALFPGGPLLRLALAAGTATGGAALSGATGKVAAKTITNPTMRQLATVSIPALAELALTRGASAGRAASKLATGPGTVTREFNKNMDQFLAFGGREPTAIRGRIDRIKDAAGGLNTDAARGMEQAARRAGVPLTAVLQDQPGTQTKLANAIQDRLKSAVANKPPNRGKLGVRERPETMPLKGTSPAYESRMIERMKAKGLTEKPIEESGWGWVAPSGRNVDTSEAWVSHSKAAGWAEGREPGPVDDFANPFIKAMLRKGWVRRASPGSYMVWDDTPETRRRLNAILDKDLPQMFSRDLSYTDRRHIEVDIMKGGSKHGFDAPQSLQFSTDDPNWRIPVKESKPRLAAPGSAPTAKQPSILPKAAIAARRKVGGPQWFYRYGE